MADNRSFIDLSPEVRLYPGPILAILPKRGCGMGAYSLWSQRQERTVEDWARLWGLQVRTLVQRVRDPKGCWPVWALHLSEHEGRVYLAKRDGITVDGVKRSIAQWAKHIGITPAAIIARLHNPRLELHDVVRNRTVGPANEWHWNCKPFEYGGITATLREHCERLGLNYTTVYGRTRARKLKYGMTTPLSVQEALAVGARKVRDDIRKKSDAGNKGNGQEANTVTSM